MRISTRNFDSFFFRSFALFERRNLSKMKDTTQRNSSEAAQQNFVKLCSYEGHNVRVDAHIHRKFWFIFFSELHPFLTYKFDQNKDTTQKFVCATPLKPINRISRNFAIMKYIMCRYAYSQEILIKFFFWE